MDEQRLHDFIKKLNPQGRLFENFYAAVLGGSNKVYHNLTTEAFVLEDSWVLTIEAALYSVEQIAKNPKKFIADDEIIVDVERARKTNAKTVRHLATNTRNIAAIEDDGSIRPKRVLTTEMREELGIYENRFICSLINRLVSFVEKRNAEIRDKYHAGDTTTVAMASEFSYGESKMSYQLEVKVKEPPRDKVQLERNYDLLHRIDMIRKRLMILKGSEFYRSLNALKPVTPPIMKTNILKMNIDYSNCYKLWLFISSYMLVGYSVEVKDKMLPVDGDFFDDMTVLSACSVQTMIENGAMRTNEYEDIPFSTPRQKKVKVVNSLKFSPRFALDGSSSEDNEAVNEFFFLKMRDALKKATSARLTAGDKTAEREINMTFGRFYRAVTKISNEMYEGMIRDSLGKPKTRVKRTPLQVKQDEYARIDKLYRRRRLLSRLKAEELERALKEEAKELVKLDMMKFELDQVRSKTTDKKERERQRKKRLAEIQGRAAQVQEKARETEETLMSTAYEELRDKEEKKRRKAEERKRRQELAQLERLKDKYET